MLRYGGHGQRREFNPITHAHTHAYAHTHAEANANTYANAHPYAGVLSQFHDSRRMQRA
jgi:hypothetical protein